MGCFPLLTLQSRYGINLTFVYSVCWRNQHFLYIEKINELPLTKRIPIGLNHLHQQSLMWPPIHPKSSSAAPAGAQPSLLQAVLAGVFLFLPAHQFWHCALCPELVLRSLSSTLRFSQLHPASCLLLTCLSHVPAPEVLREPSEEGESVLTTQVKPAHLSTFLNPSQSLLFSPARPLPRLRLARNRITRWE